MTRQYYRSTVLVSFLAWMCYTLLIGGNTMGAAQALHHPAKGLRSTRPNRNIIAKE